MFVAQLEEDQGNEQLNEHLDLVQINDLAIDLQQGAVGAAIDTILAAMEARFEGRLEALVASYQQLVAGYQQLVTSNQQLEQQVAACEARFEALAASNQLLMTRLEFFINGGNGGIGGNCGNGCNDDNDGSAK